MRIDGVSIQHLGNRISALEQAVFLPACRQAFLHHETGDAA